MGNILKMSESVEPIKIGFNWLPFSADAGVEAVARAVRRILYLLSRGIYCNIPLCFQISSPFTIHIASVSKQFAIPNGHTALLYLLGGPEIAKGSPADFCRHRDWSLARSKHGEYMEFHSIIPFLPRGVEAFVAKVLGHFRSAAVRTMGQYDRHGIHCIFVGISILSQRLLPKNLRQSPKCCCQPVQSAAKCLITGQLREPAEQVVFQIIVYRPPCR